ncbi:hypothetical protein [Streptomyces cinereoruber]|uniref:hypothetical protein n=1 Tax=Streptomyces cinereoruber TaxID=67260 RepID=UPI003634CC7B
MAGCGCSKNKGAGGRPSYKVVASNGRVLYGPTTSKETADAVSKRYPESKVEPITPESPVRR